jgi:flagellar protein FliO/FliZ
MYQNIRLLIPLLSLTLVFIGIVFAYIFVKGKGGYLNKNSSFQEISRYYYGPKIYISIIKLGDKILLLGVTENNISFLTELEKEEDLDNLEIKKKNKSSFAQLLNKKVENNMMDDIRFKLKQMRENNDEKNR